MKHLSKKTGIVALLLLGVLVLLPVTSITAQTATPVAVGGSTPGTTSWVGIFYPSPNFTGTSATGIFSNGLSQNWGTAAPADGNGIPIAGIPADNFSARFSAVATFAAGSYEFILTADDGVRLYINGSVVLEDFTASGLTTISAIVPLAGGSYNLTVEYFDQDAAAILQVSWITSTGTPGATPVPPPVAVGNVSRVRGLAVRTGPFLGASLVAVARPDIEYPLLARNTQEGIFTWYLIRYDEDTIGWSSGRYLTITGDPEALPIENSTIFDTINDTPNFDVIGVTRSVMNFRTRPSQRVARVPEVPQIYWGAEVEILARTVQGGKDFWYQVRFCPAVDVCYVGWIFAPFEKVIPGVAPIDAIPIW